MHRTVRFGMTAGAASAVIGAVGTLMAPVASGAVWTGVAIAYGAQLLLFVALFAWGFAHRPFLAHGLSVVGRFAVLAGVALIWVPRAGLPAVPLLFSLVAVLFVTTLMEPFFLLRLSTAR